MRALVVTVDRDAIELAADALWALGVDAVEERDVGGGRVELWTTVGDAAEVLEGVAGRLAQWSWRTAEVDPVPAETWREHARPVVVADSVMTIPAWLDGVEVGEGIVAVRIEPAASFGLGDHPTTRLALEHLVAALRPAPGGTVLDVGCGSGVLSIAAVGLGAARARAVDVSSAAVEAARRNVVRNGVEERVEVDGTPVAVLDGDYDVVVANILAPALVSLAADLRRLCVPGGSIVVSGVLEDHHGHVLEALRPAVPIRGTALDGWAAVTLRN